MSISLPVLEKLPPHNIDAEQAVLGSLLIDRYAVVEVAGFLHPDDFFREKHQLVYDAMCRLSSRGEPADIVMLADELERRDELPAAGGVGYIHLLATMVPTAIHVKHYAAIVQRTALKRRLISVAGRIASIGYDDSQEVDDALDEGLHLMTELTKSRRPETGIWSMGELWGSVEALYEDESPQGFGVGWPELDELYRVEPGYWTVVTGMPSSGKSEWLDAVMVNLAISRGWRFAVCSPENQPIAKHAQKLLEKKVGKPFHRAASAPAHWPLRMTEPELSDSAGWADEHFVFVLPDEDHLTVSNVLHLAALAHAKKPIQGLVIDPWNELDHQRPNNITETEYISQALTKIRRFARQYGIHVWLTAHPTKLEPRSDGTYPVPTLYSISGSAHWRNKADNGICVHRNLDQHDDAVQIHVQKVRFRAHGKPGAVEMQWQPPVGTYMTPKRAASLRDDQQRMGLE